VMIGGSSHVVSFPGLKKPKNNFYDGLDKNSQEAPGRAMFFEHPT